MFHVCMEERVSGSRIIPMCEMPHFERALLLGLWPFAQNSVLEAPMMDTVLFTDHHIVVFVITTSAIALVFSVLGLATTHRMRSDIEHQLRGLPGG
jgi:hypothetical protein